MCVCVVAWKRSKQLREFVAMFVAFCMKYMMRYSVVIAVRSRVCTKALVSYSQPASSSAHRQVRG